MPAEINASAPLTSKEVQKDHNWCKEELEKAEIAQNVCRVANLRNVMVTIQDAEGYFSGVYDDLSPEEKATFFRDICIEYEHVRTEIHDMLANPESGGYAERLEKQIKKQED